MRICDITREDEVVGTVTISVSNGEGEDNTVTELEVGKRAHDAFVTGAWGALQTMTPPALRVKDAKKAAAGKKAAATRAAGKPKATPAPAAEAAAAPDEVASTNAAPNAAESTTEAQGGSNEYASGDPGF